VTGKKESFFPFLLREKNGEKNCDEERRKDDEWKIKTKNNFQKKSNHEELSQDYF